MTAVAQATGNGVLYTVSPTVGVTGTFSKTYDGSTSAPGSFSISLTGYDQDALTSTYSNAVYGDANAGTSKTVIANGVAVTAATNGSATVYGYATHNGVRQYRHDRGASAHGDGGCAEPDLWRCQSGADLCGRRQRPRQQR